MEKYKYHFVPQEGWCNDPNGAIYVNGQYHLFYQYYPEENVWGPMHWGHATSLDAINWQYEKVALCPDDLGYIFSGSCIYDEHFMDKGALLAFYTVHNPETGEQQQCLAYSFDFVNFEKYKGNPIISNVKSDENYMNDFRDPKVFNNPVKGGYSMVLAAGQEIRFYHSENLTDWNYTGSFNPGESGFGGICECPDCFKCMYENEEYWILSLSSIIPDEKLGTKLTEGEHPYNHVMQYFIGTFDGDCFIKASSEQDKKAKVVNQMFGANVSVKNPLIMDYGLDNYAMVTFAGMTDDNPLMIGWGDCWEYVNNTPLNENALGSKSRGKMTNPRSVSLVNSPKGLRIAFEVFSDVPFEEFSLVEGQSLTLYGENGKPLVITLSDNRIWVLRKTSEVIDKHNSFFAERIYDGECEFKVYRDGNYFEIMAEKGLCPFSVMVY